MKYIPYIIIASVAILLLIYIFIIRPIQIKKLISQKVLSYFNNIGYIEIKHNKISDLVLEKEGEKIYFKYLMIPSNSQITINCKEKWRLSWGGSSAKVGRAYPNNRYITEIEDFAATTLDGKKIIIVYYSTEHILKYINECELENIDITKNTYDYKIVCFNKFEEEIPYCINK